MNGRIVYINHPRGFFFVTSGDNLKFEKFYSNLSYLASSEVPLDQIQSGFFVIFEPAASKKANGFRLAIDVHVFTEDPELRGAADVLSGEKENDGGGR